LGGSYLDELDSDRTGRSGKRAMEVPDDSEAHK
jgi:hypothetical protein